MSSTSLRVQTSPGKKREMLVISLSPGIEQVDATVLPQLLPAYLDDARANGIADSTYDLYRRQLSPFLEFLSEVAAIHEWTVSQPVLRRYPDWLRRRGLREATVETYCRRARQLLKWLFTSNRLPVDMSQWVPKPPDAPARTRVLNADELAALFVALPDAHRVRNMALLAFLVETGARRMEAAHVRWQDVRTEPDSYRGAAFLPKTKGYLLTDKTRTVVFGEVTGKLLQMLRVVQGPSEDERIFRISNVAVRQVMEAARDRAGVSFSAHDLRRTFATYWMRHCEAPNPSLAEQLLNVQLGHTSEKKSTIARKHYIVLEPTDVLRYYVSPLDEVSLPGLNR